MPPRLWGKEQKILIRVFGDGDMIYPGQTAGIHLKDLADFVAQVRDLPGIKIAGMTSFPCFLYNAEKDDIAPTANLQTVLKAKEILIDCGIEPEIINTPSAIRDTPHSEDRRLRRLRLHRCPREQHLRNRHLQNHQPLLH